MTAINKNQLYFCFIASHCFIVFHTTLYFSTPLGEGVPPIKAMTRILTYLPSETSVRVFLEAFPEWTSGSRVSEFDQELLGGSK